MNSAMFGEAFARTRREPKGWGWNQTLQCERVTNRHISSFSFPESGAKQHKESTSYMQLIGRFGFAGQREFAKKINSSEVRNKERVSSKQQIIVWFK
jgi:hypothetical protein